MPAAYSMDLRQKIVHAYQNKEGSLRQLAQRFSVSKNSVIRYVEQFQRQGDLSPKRRTTAGNPAKVDATVAEYLRARLESKPDLSLEELCSCVQQQFARSLSPSAMTRGLKKYRITRKKKPSTTLNNGSRPIRFAVRNTKLKSSDTPRQT
jgi:transposase